MTGHIDLRSCVILNIRRSSESSEAREVRLQAIRSQHQSCTTPVLTPPVTGEEQRRLISYLKIWRNSGLRLL